MKTLFKITFIFFGLIALLISCNKDSSSTCSTGIICYTEAPDSLWVRLDLTNEDYNKPVHIRFYFGNMDNGDLYDEFDTSEDEIFYLVPVNERYTAAASFIVEGDTVVVIESDKLNRKSCKDGDATCYDWDHEMTLKMKLK